MNPDQLSEIIAVRPFKPLEAIAAKTLASYPWSCPKQITVSKSDALVTHRNRLATNH